ncbi:hypothetical protein M1O56_03370 [Dehalococcoidia bacterium]|nr:hypothetical protein [Dehalococcoidia bacterium]
MTGLDKPLKVWQTVVDDVIFIARISEPQEVVYSGLFWRRSEIVRKAAQARWSDRRR